MENNYQGELSTHDEFGTYTYVLTLTEEDKAWIQKVRQLIGPDIYEISQFFYGLEFESDETDTLFPDYSILHVSEDGFRVTGKIKYGPEFTTGRIYF